MSPYPAATTGGGEADDPAVSRRGHRREPAYEAVGVVAGVRGRRHGVRGERERDELLRHGVELGEELL